MTPTVRIRRISLLAHSPVRVVAAWQLYSHVTRDAIRHMPTVSGTSVQMSPSDHFVEVPAASLPRTPAFSIPGAGFEDRGGQSVSKINHLPRSIPTRSSGSHITATWGAVKRSESFTLTWSGFSGAVRCDAGCTRVLQWKIGSGSFLWLLLLFYSIILRRRVSAHCSFTSSPLNVTEGDRRPALSRCRVTVAVPGVVVCCVAG